MERVEGETGELQETLSHRSLVLLFKPEPLQSGKADDHDRPRCKQNRDE